MDNNKKFWQRVAGIYARIMKSNDGLYEAISQEMMPSLRADMKVLELACGSGQLTFRMAHGVKEWEATDFSSAMIEEAKKHYLGGNIHFSVQDATALPYKEESYDVILIANALHIMPRPEKALDEIFRVLKPDGLLFAPTFIWGKGAKFQLRTWLMECTGVKVFHKWEEEAFVQFVSDKGFEVTKDSLIGSTIMPLCYLAARKQ